MQAELLGSSGQFLDQRRQHPSEWINTLDQRTELIGLEITKVLSNEQFAFDFSRRSAGDVEEARKFEMASPPGALSDICLDRDSRPPEL